MNELDNRQEQRLVLTGKEVLELQGVLKVDDFDQSEIYVRTVLGDLRISGSELHIAHLLLDEQQLTVNGKITAVAFVDAKSGKAGHKKAAGFFERLTK